MCGVFVACAGDDSGTPQQHASLPLLTSVRVVTTTRLAGLYHVAEAISQYLDPTHRWTIAAASRLGSVWLLQRLQALRHCGGLADFEDPLVVQEALREAAGNGHVAVLEFLTKTSEQARRVRLHCPLLVKDAAAQGHAAVLQWLDARGFVGVDATVPAVAVGNGSVACLQWLLKKKLRIDFVKTVEEAAAQGQLEAIEWLHDSSVDGAGSKVGLTRAAQNGHLHVLQWFHKRRPQDIYYAELVCAAAKAGQLAVIQWLHKISESTASVSTSCSGFAVGSAAENGHLEVVQWLLKHQSEEFPGSFLNHVARQGHLHVLQWLYDNGHCRELFTGGSASCVGDAAEGGHLAVIQWLHQVQPASIVAWRAIDRAALNGHLEVVKWLHENRSDPCCARAMDLAATNGHLEVVRFLHFNRTEGCTQDAMDGAARNGHLEIVRFLHANRSEGCTIRAMDHAAWKNHFEVVQFLHVNRLEGCSTMAMHGAARNGNLEMLVYLHANRPEGCTHQALVLAIASRSLPCIQWLLEKYAHLFTDDHWFHEATCMARSTPGTRHIVPYLIQYLDDLQAQRAQSSRPAKRIRVA